MLIDVKSIVIRVTTVDWVECMRNGRDILYGIGGFP